MLHLLYMYTFYKIYCKLNELNSTKGIVSVRINSICLNLIREICGHLLFGQ